MERKLIIETIPPIFPFIKYIFPRVRVRREIVSVLSFSPSLCTYFLHAHLVTLRASLIAYKQCLTT